VCDKSGFCAVSRFVLFLGAGASAAEGAPMQRDLFTSYFGEVAETGDQQVWAEEVANFFLRAFAVDVRRIAEHERLPTFEEVLGMIDLATSRNEGLYEMPLGLARARRPQSACDSSQAWLGSCRRNPPTLAIDACTSLSIG
jgi:hypothetical protein